VNSCRHVALSQFQSRPYRGHLGHEVKSKVPLLSQLYQSVQGRKSFTLVAMCLLQAGQGDVTEHRHKWLKCQCLLDQRHALRQVPFSRLQVVPLTQQVTQAKIIEEAAEDGLQDLRSRDHLLVSGRRLPEPALQDMQPSQ
jgi:hypothetical protein